MKFNQRISVIAAGVAIAAGLLPMSAQADAVAQSILNVSNFHFAAGNGAGRAADGSLLAFLAPGASATTTADTVAKLNGAVDNGSAIAGGEQSAVGNFGSYTPGVQLLGAPIATYAAATAAQTGNALLNNANADTDGVVSLKPTGDGSTQGNVNLNGQFTISLTAATAIEIAFDAKAFLRAMQDKGPPWFATAAYSWVMTIVDSTGNEVFKWSPDGQLNSGIVGGTEYADGFSLNDSRSKTTIGDFVVTRNLAAFEAETGTLAAGDYEVSLRQTSTADARLLPEPGSLALFGIALAGAAAAGRRRQRK